MREDKTLLFVGRTGNGKSSTANSLIGENFFGTRTDDLKIYKMTFRNNQSRITVVDGTGIGDTGADMNGDIQDTIQRTETAVKRCESGFNALIFVMTYGTRFTKQEKDAVDLIKSLFGRTIFSRFGIIVMSRGDQFEMDAEDDTKTFDKWCREQTGAIRDLFQECNYRIVLFNNRRRDEDTLDKQRQALLTFVHEDVKYSLEDFKDASNDRETLLLAHFFQEAEKEKKTFLQHIDQSLVDINSLKDDKQIYMILARLKREIEDQIKDTELKFRGKHLMYQLLTPLQTRAANVNSKMRTINQILHVKVSKEPVKRHLDEHESRIKKKRIFHEQSQENQVHARMKSERNTMFETKDTYINPISKKERELVLLFVGRTGNGKSSTANSVLGEQLFGTKKDAFKIKCKNVEIEGSNVTVVDGTGIGDTGADMNGDIQDTIQKAETAVQRCESGFNALIFVMAYGTRFTKQEKDAVDLIKSLFGRTIFSRFGIIVMSRGDQFEMDTEDDTKTFDQWCKEQTGAIRDLFQECNYRIVLFNNRRRDEDTLDKQRQALLTLVDEDVKYSLEDFKDASNDRETLLLAHDFQVAEKENQTFLQHIDQSLVDTNLLKDDKKIYEILASLKFEIEEQIKDIELKYGGRNFRYPLLTPLQIRAANVNSKMRTLNQIESVNVSQTAIKSHVDDDENGEMNKRTRNGKSHVNKVDPKIQKEITTRAEVPDSYLIPITKKESEIVAKKTVLFVGRTGNGKSSTANSVVGEQFFGTKKDPLKITYKNVEIEGSNVTVVDGTGLGDTGADMNGDIKDTILKAETAVQRCESGFNALIFVMAYGTRFTKQEKDAVDLIKSLFGRTIFSRFGIIVMSRGDQFEMDTEDDTKTFDQWCKEQTGAIRDLFQECNYRIVLFNNRGRDKDTLDKQRQALLTLVDEDVKYSLEDFKDASNDRETLLLAHDFQVAEKENQTFLQHIDQSLVDTNLLKDDKKIYEILASLKFEIEEQIKDIELKYGGRNFRYPLLTPLQIRAANVNSKMRTFNQIESVNVSQTAIKSHVDDDENGEMNKRTRNGKSHVNKVDPKIQKEITTRAEVPDSYLIPITKKESEIVVKKTVLFVGRTGNGKSATANSVVGEQFFGTKKDSLKITYKNVEIEGSNVTVVDGTGIGDTGADMNGDIQDTILKAETAVQRCESGFNALIFVMAYGTRFTKQEKDAVDLIKSLFGRTIFSRFGIIVMSRGDQFEMDSEYDRKTFDQWYKEQTGAIRDLFQECKYRIVLFNNRGRDKDTLNKQRQALLNLVPEENKYSLEDFKDASNDRETLLLAHYFQVAEKENETFLQHIDQSLVDINSLKNDKQIYEKLARLKCELEDQIKATELYFRGTHLMYQLLTPLQTRAANVNSKMRTLNQILHVTVSKEPVKRHLGELENGQKSRRIIHEKSQENQVDARMKSERNKIFETKDTYINPISKKERKFTVCYNEDDKHSDPKVKNQDSRSLPQPSQNIFKNGERSRERPQSNPDYFNSTYSRAQHEASRYLAPPGDRLSDSKRTLEVRVSDLKSDGRGEARHQSRLKVGASQASDLEDRSQYGRQPVVTHQPRSIAPLKSTYTPANNAPQPRSSWCCKEPRCCTLCYEWCCKEPCCCTRCYEWCCKEPCCCTRWHEWCCKEPCCTRCYEWSCKGPCCCTRCCEWCCKGPCCCTCC